MTFEEATNFSMPFGEYRGQGIDHIAKTDAGLRYLDWLRGEMDKPQPDRGRGIGPGAVHRALAAYLDDPSIQHDLRALDGDDD